MIAIMQCPLSSKSGAVRLLTAAHRATQWSQAVSQLTAYHSGTTDPMELANGHETRSRCPNQSMPMIIMGDDRRRRTRRNMQLSSSQLISSAEAPTVVSNS